MLRRGLFERLPLAIQPNVHGAMMRMRALVSRGEPVPLMPYEIRNPFQNVPIQGADGFLFHRDHDVIDQLAGRLVLRRRQLGIWTEAVRRRRAWCDAHGSTMRFLIIPEKHVVYRDKLPRFSTVSPRRPAMRLLGACDDILTPGPLYPEDALRRATRARQTYQRTDTHWTAFGAFIVYQALMDSLAPTLALETVRETELEWREQPFIGDLGVRFDPERGETVSVASPTSVYKLVFRNHKFARGAVHVYENERRDLPTCVLFRDSFSNALIPFLMRGFSRLVAISSLSCHYDVLEQERPDVVLFAVIERFLATFGEGEAIELPEDASGVTFEAFSGTPLASFERASP